MATVRKLTSGNKSWQAIIRRKGFKSTSKTFYSKKDALSWANLKETEISRSIFSDFSKADNSSFISELDRYWSEICQYKKSSKNFRSQINLIKESQIFKDVSLSKVSPATITAYKNYRLECGVTQATVRKDLTFIHRFFEVIQKEWHIELPQGNPTRLVSKPLDLTSTERSRRLEPNELTNLLQALENTPQVKVFVEFAIETAMRRSEIIGIRPEHVNYKKQTLSIPETKTGISREIPLSDKAISILKDIKTFNIKPDSVTQAFTRACKRAEIIGLRLHDLRHEATSRLFEKGLNPVQVALVTGHKDFRMLNRYTHLRAEDIVRLL